MMIKSARNLGDYLYFLAFSYSPEIVWDAIIHRESTNNADSREWRLPQEMQILGGDIIVLSFHEY